MPVTSTHRQYDLLKGKWARCRDTYGGSDAVKKAGIAYLPILEGHLDLPNTDRLYGAYKDRALFYPAMGRTVLGLTGVVFGKPPSITEVPPADRQMFDDITLTGVSLFNFALQLCIENLVVGRAGTFVDFPIDPKADSRPYAVIYDAESIVNWHVTRISGKQVLDLVVLKESKETFDGEDPFVATITEQYRVLRLVDGVYSVTIYTEDSQKKGTFIAGDELFPRRFGQTLDYIPFVFLGPTSLDPEPEHPPLLDLADVNISHYRNSADHEHGAHFTAVPTPYVTGHSSAPGQGYALGPGTILEFPNKDAKVGMLEFTGSGLESLANLKEEKRQLMATLGARMLETQKNVQEAAQAIRLRQTGERSVLGVMSSMLGDHLTQVIRWCLRWSNLDVTRADKALMRMNPDVMDQLTSADIQVLVATWQAGGISKKTLYHNLEWGEWTRPGVTFEQEEKDIEAEGPGDLDLPNPPPVPQDTGDEE